jgi:hypothetical protein
MTELHPSRLPIPDLNSASVKDRIMVGFERYPEIDNEGVAAVGPAVAVLLAIMLAMSTLLIRRLARGG